VILLALPESADQMVLNLAYVIDELEAQYPGIFGPNGGYSRVYSIIMSWVLGTLLGALLSRGKHVVFHLPVLLRIAP
jgi:hypothetical protein